MSNKSYNQPNREGYFGDFGGRYIPEALMPIILDIEKHYNIFKQDEKFLQEFNYYLKHYVGRPSPLFYAKKLTEYCNGAKIYFKRDELNHTGSHKINNCIGQALLAKYMGKKRIIAETGAGQHGVATATVCALFDMECVIYMGAKDIKRQQLNVLRMKLLGAEVKEITSAEATLRNAMNEALRDWVSQVEDTYYLIGTAAGSHPYPMMVRDFQSQIGKEAKQQILEAENRNPDLLVAAIGGGSNSIGLFYPFIEDDNVKMTAVEAGGQGIDSGLHAASINCGSPAILHGNKSYYLQDKNGQIQNTYSISAGLDYPGIGPEHAYLHSISRVNYQVVTDDQALEALQLCAKLEGIIPALEPAHALYHTLESAKKMPKDQIIIMNLCGRGDKDMAIISQKLSL